MLTNADGVNGVGGGSEAFKESLFYGAQAGRAARPSIVGRSLIIRHPQKGPFNLQTQPYWEPPKMLVVAVNGNTPTPVHTSFRALAQPTRSVAACQKV